MEKSKPTGNFLPPKRPSGYEMLKKLDPDNSAVIEYQKKIKEYQKNYISSKDSIKKYAQKVFAEKKEINIGKINFDFLYEIFLSSYRLSENCNFDENSNDGEGRIFAKTMLMYFISDRRFLKSPLISKITNPSMDKGILIVGKWGNGKTSVLKAIHQMFSQPYGSKILCKNTEGEIYPLSFWKINFGFFTANKVVDDYEWRGNTEKAEFWKLHTSGKKIYDDVLTERQVSNYGKFEIFKDVLEKRNAEKLKSIVTLNYTTDKTIKDKYKEKSPIEISFIEIGLRYGNRVYDRLHSDFTVIELNGKSLRK